MVAAEDSRGCTALHYACRTLAKSESSASREELNLIKEGAEEASAHDGECIPAVSLAFCLSSTSSVREKQAENTTYVYYHYRSNTG